MCKPFLRALLTSKITYLPTFSMEMSHCDNLLSHSFELPQSNSPVACNVAITLSQALQSAQSAKILSVMPHKSALTVTKVPLSPMLHPLFNETLMSLWTHYCVGLQSINILLTVHESSQQ